MKTLARLSVVIFLMLIAFIAGLQINKPKIEVSTLKDEFPADYIDGELKPTLESVDSLNLN